MEILQQPPYNDNYVGLLSYILFILKSELQMYLQEVSKFNFAQYCSVCINVVYDMPKTLLFAFKPFRSNSGGLVDILASIVRYRISVYAEY